LSSLGDQALEAGMFAEAVAQQVCGGGVDCVRRPLVGGESADKIQNQRDIGGSSAANRVHRWNFSLQRSERSFAALVARLVSSRLHPVAAGLHVAPAPGVV